MGSCVAMRRWGRSVWTRQPAIRRWGEASGLGNPSAIHPMGRSIWNPGTIHGEINRPLPIFLASRNVLPDVSSNLCLSVRHHPSIRKPQIHTSLDIIASSCKHIVQFRHDCDHGKIVGEEPEDCYIDVLT